MDAAAGEGKESPVLNIQSLREWLDEHFGDGDLGLEDQGVLQVEKGFEIGGLGDIAAGGGNGLGVGCELGFDGGSHGCGLIAEDLIDIWVRDKRGFAGEGVVALEGETGVHLVLEVLSDGWEINYNWNVVLAEDIWVTNSRVLENDRGLEGTCGEDDLLVGGDDIGTVSSSNLDTCGNGITSSIGEHDLVGVGVEEDVEVCAILNWEVVCSSSIDSDILGSIKESWVFAETGHLSTVDIWDVWDTESSEGIVDDSVQSTVQHFMDPTNLLWAIAVVVGVVVCSCCHLVLIWYFEGSALLVVREETLPVPAIAVSKLLPCINLRVLSTCHGHTKQC